MAKKSTSRKSTPKKPRTTVKKSSRRKRPDGAKPASPKPGSHLNGAKRPCRLSQMRLQRAKDFAGGGSATSGASGGRPGEPFFHKGLQHDIEGTVDPHQWRRFVDGLIELDRSGDPRSLSEIEFEADNRKWVNPTAGWAVDVEASDMCFHSIPAPPAVDSDEEAAEALELYWMAVLRDLPFGLWNDDANIQQAIQELRSAKMYINRSGDVNSAPIGKNGYVTNPDLDVARLFRGGELFVSDPIRERRGPYISQFLFQDIPYGTLQISQKQIYASAYQDYLTTPEEWRAVQNGEPRDPMQNVSEQRRYISTMRDLATYVHFDQLYQAYLNAALILIQNGYDFDSGNPYGSECPPHGGIGFWTMQKPSQALGQNQAGFAVFGGAHVLSLVTEVATRALKAVWRQKWTHLRLRPETYGGLVEFRRSLLGRSASTVVGSQAYRRIVNRNGNGLLPMAFPEGSPMHPAYGAGHATVAGACVTILKAFFDESQPVVNPVQSSVDGNQLQPYEGSDAGALTVGLELDKLAANISIGRNMAGVHWRSDYTQSVLLGQRVAIDMLFRQCRDYIEEYCFSLTTFGGGTVHIGNDGVKFRANAKDDSQPMKTILSARDFGFNDRVSRRYDQAIADALLQIV